MNKRIHRKKKVAVLEEQVVALTEYVRQEAELVTMLLNQVANIGRADAAAREEQDDERETPEAQGD